MCPHCAGSDTTRHQPGVVFETFMGGGIAGHSRCSRASGAWAHHVARVNVRRQPAPQREHPLYRLGVLLLRERRVQAAGHHDAVVRVDDEALGSAAERAPPIAAARDPAWFDAA